MHSAITLILPFPPSMNTYWRSPSRGALKGRVLISENGRRFRLNVIADILEHFNGRTPKPITGDISLQLVLFPPTAHRRDLDNFIKAIQDALTHAGIWNDDSQVKHLDIEWGEKVAGGKSVVTISPYVKRAVYGCA